MSLEREPASSTEALTPETAHPTHPRFHTERQGRLDERLPIPSTAEHALFIERAYATARARVGGKRSENPYALLPDTLSFLGTLVEECAPRIIVEFGSGESTYLFAREMVARGGELVSVEHDRRWVSEVERRLDVNERRVVRLLHAPLRLSRRGLRSFLCYSHLE